jgi:predicted methyltransferase
VSKPQRSDGDRERDAGRKPSEVLEFFDIQPGMKVLDLFSGGGYYSEILSYVVGPEGSVTAHSNEAYAQYVGEEVLTRYAGDRLPNVKMLMAENNELSLTENSFDAIILILTFHDIFYVDANSGWAKIDGPKLLAELFKGVKPGGVVGIVDHYAAAGASRETGNTLHRVDPAIVIEDMEAAGFVADGKSEILRNADDDYAKNMADPTVRGKTDRFVMRFVKPE